MESRVRNEFTAIKLSECVDRLERGMDIIEWVGRRSQ